MTGGNMYGWVNYTWNPLAGQCPHNCEYCYVKSLVKRYPSLREKYSGSIRLDEKALKHNIPAGRIVFVCSMNDLFAKEVPDEYIHKILKVTRENWLGRTFLFQTKNPARMFDFIGEFPECSIFITTIESNRSLIKTNAPPPEQRYRDFLEFKEAKEDDSACDLFDITIEPIVVFDIDILSSWIEEIRPNTVNIGADSKRNGLPEPSEADVITLVNRLQNNRISVYLKSNLRRIAPSLFTKNYHTDPPSASLMGVKE